MQSGGVGKPASGCPPRICSIQHRPVRGAPSPGPAPHHQPARWGPLPAAVGARTLGCRQPLGTHFYFRGAPEAGGRSASWGLPQRPPRILPAAPGIKAFLDQGWREACWGRWKDGAVPRKNRRRCQLGREVCSSPHALLLKLMEEQQGQGPLYKKVENSL